MFAYPYGYSRHSQPTPLFPTNRRPAPQAVYTDPQEAAYLRALARERAAREAQARYSPFFGYAPQADEDEEDDERSTYYLPRSRQDLYAARRQAEHERQLREREALNQHLQEQRRRELARAALAQQQQQQGRKSKSPSPARAADPVQHAQHAQPGQQKPTTASKPTHPLEQQSEAATLIQSAYRAHRARQLAQSALHAIGDKLAALLSGFQLPETLDFDLASLGYPGSGRGDESEQGAEQEEEKVPIPKLLYTARNKPVHAQEHQLTLLLQELDGVESHGESAIRMRRKALVGRVEAALRELERAVREVWERQQHGQAEALEDPALRSEEQPERGRSESPTSPAKDVPLPASQGPSTTSTGANSMMDVDDDSGSTGTTVAAGDAPLPLQPELAHARGAPEEEEEDGWEDVRPEEVEEQEVEQELPTAQPSPAPGQAVDAEMADAADDAGEDGSGTETETEWEGFQTAEEPEFDIHKEESKVPEKVPVRIPTPPAVPGGPWRVVIH